MDTLIEDAKLDGRFVKRIRRSDHESLIGVLKKAGTHFFKLAQDINVAANTVGAHANNAHDIIVKTRGHYDATN